VKFSQRTFIGCCGKIFTGWMPFLSPNQQCRCTEGTRAWSNLLKNLSLRFNGHFPDGYGLAATRTSPFWILLELRVMEVVSGDNWSCKTSKAPVKSSQSTNQHPVFYRPDALPPNQQCQTTEWKNITFQGLAHPSVISWSSNFVSDH